MAVVWIPAQLRGLTGGRETVPAAGRTVAEVIDTLAANARVPVRRELDPARLRSHDARDVRGSHERLTAATGWRPEIPLEETIRSTLDWWRGRLASG